ncbi:MAG: 4Fe-4S binding protein [Armatimonadetes bacterium]|nr:4Fe-4S binding protein [Armatimonadota bacterium]
MKRTSLALTGLLAPLLAMGQEQKRQPPPDFTLGYQLPSPTTPVPKEALFAWFDVGVLLLALVLAAYIVLSRRSRAWLLVLTAFSATYFGFYRLGCVCSVGSVQNVVLAFAEPSYRLSLSVAAFFLLPLLFALFYGRVFCSGVCPLGAIQELVLVKPLRIPDWIAGPLGLVPFLYLGLAVLYASSGAGFVVCRYDPFIALYRLGSSPLMAWLTGGFLAASLFIGRPYCRFLCPYGALLRVASWLASKPARIAPAACISCHLCAKECPYGAILPPSAEGDRAPLHQLRRTLARRLAVAAPLVVCLTVLGWFAGPAMARVHPKVTLARELALSLDRPEAPKTLAVEAHRRLGRSDEEVFREAAAIQRSFRFGGAAFGAWAGVVVAAYTVSLALRRRRREYVAEPGTCFACARCFASCPVLPNGDRS